MKILGIAMLSVLLLSGCKERQRDCTEEERKTLGQMVTKIGGCDHSGWCGVRFEDGNSDVALYPVLGARTYKEFEARYYSSQCRVKAN